METEEKKISPKDRRIGILKMLNTGLVRLEHTAAWGHVIKSHNFIRAYDDSKRIADVGIS